MEVRLARVHYHLPRCSGLAIVGRNRSAGGRGSERRTNDERKARTNENEVCGRNASLRDVRRGHKSARTKLSQAIKMNAHCTEAAKRERERDRNE